VYRSAGREITTIQFNPFENPYAPCRPTTAIQPPETEVPGVPFEVPLALDSYEQAKRDLDITFIRRALAEAEGNQKEAASAMGLTYDQFRGLYRKYKEILEA
jgi:psp operon transcriptional activator